MKGRRSGLIVKTIFFLIFISFAGALYAQKRPDLTKIKTNEARVEAWRVYCNSLLDDMKHNKRLISEAKYGLAFCDKNNDAFLGVFALFAGVAYEKEKQFDSAAYYLEKAAIHTQKAGKIRNHVLALSRLDYVYDYANNTAKRKHTLERMKKIGDTSTSLPIKQMITVALGGYYSDIEDYETSIKYRLQSIEQYKKLIKTDTLVGEEYQVGYFLTNIGGLYIQMGRYQKAIEYLDEAASYLGNRVLKDGEQTLYGSYIRSYLGLNRLDSAKAYYNRIYRGMKGIDSIYNLLSYANQYFAGYYLEQNKPDSAVYYAREGMRLGRKSAEADPLMNANIVYGKILFKQHKYADAILFLTPALHNAYDFDKEMLANIHDILSKSYAMLKQWDKAYFHKEKYSDLNDIIQLAKANRNFNEIEAKYQNSQKIQQIKLKDLALHEARKQRIWLFSGLLLLLFTAVLLLVIYNNKKKAAFILDKKNAELDLANEHLALANQTKAKLFSIISHDLRSPVSQLFTFLRLQQTNSNILSEEKKQQHQQKLIGSARQLLATMEDLLIWSKSQMEHFELNIMPVAMADLLTTAIRLMQDQAEARNIGIRIGELTLKELKSDENLLTIVLRNLLQNAIHSAFSHTEIILGAGFTIAGNPVITVFNKGDAIPQEKIQTLLENNQVGSKSSGYGLVIVKELLQKINARLQIVSNTEGTTLTVEFMA